MNRTDIEWVKNPDGSQGYTLNPAFGCSRGCSYCYARGIAKRWVGGRVRFMQCEACREFKPHLHLERLGQIYRQKKPAGIFLCSMGELFDPELPAAGLERILGAIADAPQHRFYLLTKRTAMASLKFPGNVWLGVTCDGQSRDRDQELVNALDSANADGKKYISFEPLLGPAEVPNFVDWIIIGPQTKPLRKPNRKWVEKLIEQADRRGIPVFLKDKLLGMFPDMPKRQEMPGTTEALEPKGQQLLDIEEWE